jgi:hypothetical protein
MTSVPIAKGGKIWPLFAIFDDELSVGIVGYRLSIGK